MNRREAIVAGAAGIAATVAGPSVANAEASPGERPELQPIRALLHAHDEAFTNLNGVNGLLCGKSGDNGERARRNLVGTKSS